MAHIKPAPLVQIENSVQKRITSLIILSNVSYEFILRARDFIRGLTPGDYVPQVQAVLGLRRLIQDPNVLFGPGPITTEVDIAAAEKARFDYEQFKPRVDAGTATKPVLPDDQTAQLEWMFMFYNNLAWIDDAVITVFKMLSNTSYTRALERDMSITYTMDMRDSASHAKRLYEQSKANGEIDDDAFISQFLNAFAKDDTRLNTLFNFLVADRPTNKFIIKAMYFALQHVTPIQRRQLQLIVEQQKNITLGVSRVTTDAAGMQGQLLRYGLTPATASMEAHELVERMGLEAPASREDPLTTLACMAGPDVGVIVLTNTGRNAIEFTLRGLIDAQFIADRGLRINPMAGLNKKVLEKYETAKRIDAPVVLPALPPRVFNDSAPAFYVFETTNGVSYRALGVHGRAALKIPRDELRGLLEGITNRPSRYNMLQERRIIAKCFDKHHALLMDSYMRQKMVVENSDLIKSKVVEMIVANFKKTLAESRPKTPEVLRERASNRLLVRKVLIDAIEYRLPVGTLSSEKIITTTLQLESLLVEYVRELERNWLIEPLSESVFREAFTLEKFEQLDDYILKAFADVAKRAADALDRENMWTNYGKSIKEHWILGK